MAKTSAVFDKAIFYLYVFLVFSAPLTFCPNLHDSFTLPKTFLVRLIALLIFMLWLLKSSFIDSFKFKFNSSFILFLPLLLSISISSLFSTNPHFSFFGAYKRYEDFVTYLVYAFLFAGAINFIKTKELKKLATAAIVSSSLVSLYAILQHFGFDFLSVSPEAGAPRSFSTFGNPTILANYLVMIFPISLALFLIKDRYWRYPFVILPSLSFFALIFTGSKAGIFAFAVSIIVFCFSLTRSRYLKIALFSTLIFMVIFSVVFALAIPEFFATRSIIWQSTARMIKLKPFFGYGPDSLSLIYPKFLPKSYYLLESARVDKAHNEVLQIAATLGLVGMLFFLALLFSLAFQSVDLIRSVQDLKEKTLFTGIFAGSLAYITAIQFSFSQNEVTFLFWIFVGALVANAKNKKIWLGLNKSHKPILLILFFVAFCGFYLVSVKPLIANYYFTKAASQEKRGEITQAINNYTVATKYNPNCSIYWKSLAQMYQSLALKGPNKNTVLITSYSVDLYKKAISIDPFDSLFYVNLGHLSLVNQDIEGGLTYYRKCLSIEPPLADAYIGLGAIYSAKDLNRAAKFTRKALVLEPDNIEALINMAIIKLKQGKKESSLNYLKVAKKLEPYNPKINNTLKIIRSSR